MYNPLNISVHTETRPRPLSLRACFACGSPAHLEYSRQSDRSDFLSGYLCIKAQINTPPPRGSGKTGRCAYVYIAWARFQSPNQASLLVAGTLAGSDRHLSRMAAKLRTAPGGILLISSVASKKGSVVGNFHFFNLKMEKVLSYIFTA